MKVYNKKIFFIYYHNIIKFKLKNNFHWIESREWGRIIHQKNHQNQKVEADHGLHLIHRVTHITKNLAIVEIMVKVDTGTAITKVEKKINESILDIIKVKNVAVKALPSLPSTKVTMITQIDLLTDTVAKRKKNEKEIGKLSNPVHVNGN